MNYRALLFAVLYAIAALVIFSMVKSPGLFDNRAGVIAMTQFEAHKPFQYRALMPVLVRLIESLTPAEIVSGVNREVREEVAIMTKPADPDLEGSKTWLLGQYGYRCIIYLILNVLMLYLFLLTLRYLALTVKSFSRLTCDLLPLGMVAVMPIFFDYGNYMYDFSHLFLFTWGLLMLYRERWLAFMIVFTLALLNKETAIMLTVIFAIYFHTKLTRPVFFKLLVIQLSIFLVIKISLHILFRANPGGMLEWHLMWNLQHLSYPANYFRFKPIGQGLFSPFNIPLPVPRGLNLPMFAVIIASVAYKWRDKPLFLRKSTGYFIISLVLGLMFGIFYEWRSYYDALPIIYLLGLIGLSDFTSKLKSIMIGY